MKQLISVIVPVYNVEKYLQDCIDSILKQTYQHIEIILVNDGSKDSCGEICKLNARLDKRIKVINKENGGLISAWKRGLEESSKDSEYVVFVDSDDWIGQKHIENMANEAMKTGADMVTVPILQAYPDKYIDTSSDIEAKYYNEVELKKDIYPILLNAGDFEKRTISTSRCGKLIRKQLILDNLKYVDNKVTYSEDLSIIFPVLLDMKSISVLKNDNSAYFYRMNPDSMLHAYDKNMQKSIQYVHPMLLKICNEKNKKEFEIQVYADYLAAMVQAFKNELQNDEGLNVGKENIKKMCKRQMLIQAIDMVEWKHYRKLNVLIIKAMSDYNWFYRNIVTNILFCLKNYKVKKLERNNRKIMRGK